MKFQIVDSDYNILNVRVCPGSNNDRFVWQFSEAKEYMDYLRGNENIVQEEGYYHILGKTIVHYDTCGISRTLRHTKKFLSI